MLILLDRALEKARQELSGFEEVSVCEELRLNFTVVERGLNLSLYSAKDEYDPSLLTCTSELSIKRGQKLFEYYMRKAKEGQAVMVLNFFNPCYSFTSNDLLLVNVRCE